MENEIKDCYECAKKCENCEFLKEHYQREKEFVKKNNNVINWMCGITLLVISAILICNAMGYSLEDIKNYFVKPTKTIYINGNRVKIDEDSYLGTLIDSGLCTTDDVQRFVDDILSQWGRSNLSDSDINGSEKHFSNNEIIFNDTIDGGIMSPR